MLNAQNGQATHTVAASIFGGKRLRANGQHTHTQRTLTHTHTHIITFGVGAWLLWLLEKSFIENDARRQMASLSLNVVRVCVRVCMFVCALPI